MFSQAKTKASNTQALVWYDEAIGQGRVLERNTPRGVRYLGFGGVGAGEPNGRVVDSCRE